MEERRIGRVEFCPNCSASMSNGELLPGQQHSYACESIDLYEPLGLTNPFRFVAEILHRNTSAVWIARFSARQAIEPGYLFRGTGRTTKTILTAVAAAKRGVKVGLAGRDVARLVEVARSYASRLHVNAELIVAVRGDVSDEELRYKYPGVQWVFTENHDRLPW